MPRTAIAIRHVAFEDLGSFRASIERAGYTVRYCDAGVDDLSALDSAKIDVAVVLGGPIGAYEDEAYPFLRHELGFLRDRLTAGLPTLGICLGAQLMARALGARVYPGPAKEIGWARVDLTDAGKSGPLRHLGEAPVLHWHGDTFDLPSGSELLASTELCRNQAFAYGPNALGLQFHPEATKAGFERWLVGHASELTQVGIAPQLLRAQTEVHAAELEQRAGGVISDWLAALQR